MRFVVTACLVAGLLSGGACDEVNKDTERERLVASEQSAISSYSREVPKADLHQEDFVKAWERANEIKGLKAFQDAMTAQVIPKLESYVSTLQSMPTESDELGRIHGTVVEGYAKAILAFQVFVDGLTEENVEARYKELLSTMEQVARAEKSYRRELKGYYARSRVRLVDSDN